jgi:hypothetical protein
MEMEQELEERDNLPLESQSWCQPYPTHFLRHLLSLECLSLA